MNGPSKLLREEEQMSTQLSKYDIATRDAIRQMHTLRLSDEQRHALLTNKQRIEAMLRERTSETTAMLGEAWADGCAFFSYSLELPPEAWTKLRLHTYHFTGDNYQAYLLGQPGPVCDVWANEVADLPERLMLSEPVGEIGFAYQGRLISSDIVRFQHVVGTLCRQGVLEQLTRPAHPLTLEIGSGYGGLAYHLHRIIGRGTRVLLDLPETLLFAAQYLAVNCPDARVYLYGSGDAPAALAEPHAYDFILLPNFRLDLLRSWRFDLAINMESLQEMRATQVDEYLAFLAQTSQLFYSYNQDANPINHELNDLSIRLRRYFHLTPVPLDKTRPNSAIKQALRVGLAKLGLSVTRIPRNWVNPTGVEYLCSPSRSASNSLKRAGST